MKDIKFCVSINTDWSFFIRYMRIIEIDSKNIKIVYKPAEDNLAIGDFVDITEGATTLIAQAYKLYSDDNSSEYNYALLNVLLTVKYGKAYAWNGEVVSGEAKVQKTSWEFIENHINNSDFEDVFALGYCSGTYNQPMRLNFKNFQTPAFVGYEDFSDNLAFLKSTAYQMQKYDKKLLVIDYNGNIEIDGAKRVTAGFEQKLPLNSAALEKLSSKMTDGVSLESRAVIEEVLTDLADFAKETGDFISITRLIDVINETYKKTKIAQLILLKNKLRSYQKQNLFADSLDETVLVNQALALNNLVIFDISNLKKEWQNEFLKNLLTSEKKNGQDFYLYLNIEQSLDNNLLRYLLFKSSKHGIKPILGANYRQVAMDTILDFCPNSFLFQTSNNLDKREYLSDILKSLAKDYFVVMGKLTSSLAITSYLGEPIDNIDEKALLEKQMETNETLDIIQESINIEDEKTPVPVTNVNMDAINTAIAPELVVQLAEITEVQEEKTDDTIAQEPAVIEQEEAVLPEVADVQPPEETADIQPELPQSEEQTQPQTVELLPVEEITQEPVAETITEPEPIADAEEIEFTPDEELIDISDTVQEEPSADDLLDGIEVLDDEFTEQTDNQQATGDDDLDFLDVADEEQQPYTQNDEDELLDLLSETEEDSGDENVDIDDIDFEETDIPAEPETPQPQEQKLPVYNADYEKKPKKQNSLNLQEGDLVKHNKYGLGTVKKLINHGNKVMCFINFEDFGRRLLDPEISQLEKIQ